ncbi:hypothetical protein ZIOFF_005941 [Zingiber officinale]|uniref:Regulatory protein RecX n=1 Tax=Zingiber officinale TaxID=94328 RepID=A0A8J5HRI2_ZINOF|nr:hypothetical protein ZIOFF_005941 [Zingiber officinale]
MLGSFIMVPGEDAKIIKAVAFSSISTCKGKKNNPIVRGTSRAIEDDGSFYETIHFDEDDKAVDIVLACMITTSSRTQVNNVELMQNHYKVAPAQQRKCCAMCGGPDHHSRVRRSMCLFFLLLLSLFFYLVDSMECALDNNFEVSLVEAQDSSVMTNSETVMERPIKQEAEQMAIELLAARAFTTLELRKKLRGKRYPKDVVAAVISSAKERGLLNDGLYAESFSRSRWLSSTWGPKRIKWVLVQKGVSETEVDTATRQVFQEDDSGDKSRSTQHGISEPAFKRLYVKATKQWLQGQSSSLENRKARIVRWLQYRGFSWGVTNIILRKLLSEYPP